MKFKALLSLMLVAGFALTGCSQPEPEIQIESDVVISEEEEATTTLSGDFVSEVTSEGSTDVTVITVSYKDGKPVDVHLDVRTENGSKRELVASGQYDMFNDGLTWSEQIDALQTFIVENDFDLSKVTLSDEAGHTDAITGVSITIGFYLPMIQDLIESVENGTYVAPGTTSIN